MGGARLIYTGAKRIADDEPPQAQVAACMMALLSHEATTVQVHRAGNGDGGQVLWQIDCYAPGPPAANGLMSASEKVGTTACAVRDGRTADRNWRAAPPPPVSPESRTARMR